MKNILFFLCVYLPWLRVPDILLCTTYIYRRKVELRVSFFYYTDQVKFADASKFVAIKKKKLRELTVGMKTLKRDRWKLTIFPFFSKSEKKWGSFFSLAQVWRGCKKEFDHLNEYFELAKFATILNIRDKNVIVSQYKYIQRILKILFS